MPIQERRARQREERRRAIIDAARRLAEEEGWSAVTIRRLADRIEYSQPVLYTHFQDKLAIMQAVAIEGFVELTGLVHRARVRAKGSGAALRGVTRAYLDFAGKHPALYEAMFSRAIGLEFASASTRPELHAAFVELVATLEPVAGARPIGSLTELYWSTLHGVATLTRGARLSTADTVERFNLLNGLFGAPHTASSRPKPRSPAGV